MLETTQSLALGCAGPSVHTIDYKYALTYTNLKERLQYVMSVEQATGSPVDGLGARLREERVRLGLTQAVAASRAGVCVPTQVAYERSTRTPPVPYLSAIEALGFDAHYVRVGTRSERYATDALDWSVFKKVVEAVEAWANGRGLELGTWKTVELSRLLYDLVISDNALSDQKVDRVLTLVCSG